MKRQDQFSAGRRIGLLIALSVSLAASWVAIVKNVPSWLDASCEAVYWMVVIFTWREIARKR